MRWIIYALKLMVAGGLIYWLIDSGLLDPAPLLGAPLSMAFFLGPVFTVLYLLLCGLRWAMLLHVHHPEIRFRDVIVWQWIGEFFGMFTPGGGGGEAARVYYIFRNTEKGKIAALSTVILDRVIGLYSLLFMGGLSFAILVAGGGERSQYLDLLGATIIALFVGASGLFLAFNIALVRDLGLRLVPGRFRQSFASMFDAYLNRKKVVFLCFLVSIAAQFFLFGTFILAGMHLSATPDILAVLLVVPLLVVANTLPISPGGLGVGEAVASVMFLQFGMPDGAGIMLIVRLWQMLVQLPGGIVFLLQRGPSKKYTQGRT